MKEGVCVNFFFVVSALCLSTSVALAQGKIESQWICKAKIEQSIDVGDQPGHAYGIAQIAVKGEIDGQKEKEGTAVEFDDVKEGTIHARGVFVETLPSGDKLFVGFREIKTVKGQMASASNTWTINNGTGKFKGAKGKGSCKGKGNPDGSATFDCTGEYTLAK